MDAFKPGFGAGCVRSDLSRYKPMSQYDNQTTIEVAKTLAEALPYIRQFQGAVLVIKLGGSTITDDALLDYFARDLVLLKLIGFKPLVVHGGGVQINEMLDRLGKEARFVDGMRVTDAEAMDVVQMVLGGKISKAIVSHIHQNEGQALSITGKDGGLIKARKLREDLGQVGEVVQINRSVLDVLLESHFIPVIAPIGYGNGNTTYNINADVVAGAIATELQAEKLISLTNTAGVLDKDGQVLSKLNSQDVKRLSEQGNIHSGMLPKVNCALQAVAGGVRSAHIINGQMPHALLVEMLTDKGIGTLIEL